MSQQIDPRGQRFAASLTAVVLATVLLLAPDPIGVALLAAQVVLFAIGAGMGVQRTPYARLYRSHVRPRLGPPREWEDAAPPRFAQAVGLVFAAVGLAGFVAGADTVGLVATGLALVAALLNAVFGLCLGCELYLLGRRGLARSPLAEASQIRRRGVADSTPTRRRTSSHRHPATARSTP